MATIEKDEKKDDFEDLDPDSAVDTARFTVKHKDLEVDKLFRALVKLEGSDLHMKVGRPPMVRVRGELRPLNRGPVDAEEMVRLLFPMMTGRTRAIFDEEG
ncbi:MAG: hypothetical protein ACC628_20465, partial [Pirellulaceae bacterium]